MYSEVEMKKYGKEWTCEQIVQGFVSDVGDLVKFVMSKEGVRETEDVDKKLAHELSNCLWSILVIANKFGVNIEKSFLETMNEIETRISAK